RRGGGSAGGGRRPGRGRASSARRARGRGRGGRRGARGRAPRRAPSPAAATPAAGSWTGTGGGGRGGEPALEQGPGGASGPPPVAEDVLLRRGKLGHGAPQVREEEDGVVAEAVAAPRRVRDRPLSDAVDGVDQALPVGEGHDAAESGAAG